MKKRILFQLFTLLISTTIFAQKGELIGVIIDEKTLETIPFVTVSIENSEYKIKTDFDGVFKFGVNTGTYKIKTQIPEYEDLIIDYTFSANNKDTLIIKLKPEATVLEDVVVRADRIKSGTNNLLVEQKNAATVSDGISAEEIKKKPDSKTSDVLKRISGASIQENKFVIIRGLNDRYNGAFINGAPLPSSESDRKAFSFDIFPSNILDNIVINKTATPDMPAEFAGGYINIETKNPTRQNFQTIQIGSSINTITSFKDFKTYEGGKLDFLGILDKNKLLPSVIPTTQEYSLLNNAQRGELAQQMTPSWKLDKITALPTINLQYGIGRSYSTKNNQQFSFVFAYAYQNTTSTTQSIRREFEEAADKVVLKSELVDSIYTRNILNTGLLNFNYQFNQKHSLSFKNIYSLSSDDRVAIRNGVRELDNNPHIFEKSSNRWYTHNQFYSGQLIGKHELSSKINFDWNMGISDVQRVIPNMRRIVYHKNATDINDPNENFYAVIQNNGTIPTAAGNMFWSTTNEKIYNIKYDLTYKILAPEKESKIKVGAYHQIRNREFNARNFGFSRYKPSNSQFDYNLLTLNEEEIFTAENLGIKENGLGGFKLDEATKVSDSYTASSNNHAAYAMIDIKPIQKLRVIGGARFESYNQKFNYIEFGSNLNRTIDTTVIDILPSLNLVYALNDNSNLRFSYSNTVSRPEFRELAPFAFYNYALDNILSGNPNLKRALINNFDLRYEIFPKAGQMFSVSGFYKNFTNAIELINRPGTSGASELYYTNIENVKNYGLEIEFRTTLNSILKSDKEILKNTSLFANATIVKSIADVSKIVGQVSNERPLQGQSPYIINTGITYNNPEKQFSISASYNVVGKRIFIVGNMQEPDVWEKERHMIDLQFAKTFKEKFEFKLNVRDLLAQKLIFYQDINFNNKFDKNTDNRWQEISFGQTISMSLSYKF